MTSMIRPHAPGLALEGRPPACFPGSCLVAPAALGPRTSALSLLLKPLRPGTLPFPGTPNHDPLCESAWWALGRPVGVDRLPWLSLPRGFKEPRGRLQLETVPSQNVTFQQILSEPRPCTRPGSGGAAGRGGSGSLAHPRGPWLGFSRYSRRGDGGGGQRRGFGLELVPLAGGDGRAVCIKVPKASNYRVNWASWENGEILANLITISHTFYLHVKYLGFSDLPLHLVCRLGTGTPLLPKPRATQPHSFLLRPCWACEWRPLTVWRAPHAVSSTRVSESSLLVYVGGSQGWSGMWVPGDP